MTLRYRAAFAAAFLGLCSLAAPAAAQVQPVAVPAAPAPLTATPITAAPITAVLQPAAPQASAPPSGTAPSGTPMPLADLVASFRAVVAPDATADCLAKAVYFEARGESLEGQLAVAEVVLNRAASGIYPSDVCGVITQRAQFSFIRNGAFPTPDRGSSSWQTALAITHVARSGLARVVSSDVLWYHANYVAPRWGRFHTQVARIGAHIFYS